jgi:hypothetical protein
MYGGTARLSRPPSTEERRVEAAPVVLASAAGPGAIVPAADLWLDIVNEWTRTLREAPPDDPARATARHLSSLARRGVGAVPLADAVSEVGGEAPAALATRFGPGPFLLVETTRWVLVGCFHEFTPWFNIRATLVEAGTGKVLWRDRCGGAYPAGARAHWPGALEADGKALYARLIADRAAGCAAALLASLERETAAPAGGPGR